MTCHRFRHAQRVRAGRSEHLACSGADLRHSAHRSAGAPRAATLSSAEEADWRRRRKRPTRPARAGEGWGRVHYAPARPRPLGEHGVEPHGLLFTRTFRATRIAAVSQCLMSTGTAPPDGGKSTTVPDGSGTASSTPAPRGGSGGPGDVSRSLPGPLGPIAELALSLLAVRQVARERG